MEVLALVSMGAPKNSLTVFKFKFKIFKQYNDQISRKIVCEVRGPFPPLPSSDPLSLSLPSAIPSP